MREDIHGGLRNALERGATMEQAIQSFINAGYNPIEVREAANSVGGILPFITEDSLSQELKPMSKDELKSIAKGGSPSASSYSYQPVKMHRSNGKIIALLIVLLLLLGALGATIFFRTQIIEFIKGLL